MKLKFQIIAFLITVLIPVLSHSQGCSDAGFCTVHSIKTTESADSSYMGKNLIKTGISIGSAQYNVMIISPYIEYSRIINEKITTTIKMLYSVHYGDIATTQALSDVIATTNYKLSASVNLIGGIKIPLNAADKSHNGLNLPMSYQTSLGTTDVIAGISYKKKNLSLTFAYQQPLTQNKNKFFIEDYPTDIINSNYKSTNSYVRKPDVLLRLSHNCNFKNKRMVLISSILPIYHIGDDSFVNKQNETQDIIGSKGLTLNLNIFYQYKFSDSRTIEFSVGAPVVSREVRPDGLSQFALGVEYSITF